MTNLRDEVWDTITLEEWRSREASDVEHVRPHFPSPGASDGST